MEIQVPGPHAPKWLTSTVLALISLFVVVLIAEHGSALSDKIKNRKPQNTMSVSAEGKVDGRPDLATVTIGVMSQGSTAVAVKDDNNKQVNAITAFVKSQGIPEADITTTQFSFYPQQDWQNGKGTITGYQGNQSVTVKVRGIDKSQTALEKVLDGAVNVGANQVPSVMFSISDPDNLKQQARKEAIAKAREKAQELASEAGLSLGKVVSVSESGSPSGYPMPYATDASYSLGVGGGMAEKSVAPDIQPGTQEVTQSMTVVFEIK